MTTKKKIIIIAIAILLIAVILFFAFRKKDAEIPAPTEPMNVDTTKPSPFKENVFPLDLNMKGDYVLTLQRALNRIKPENKISEDGIFGFQTKTKLLLTVPTTQSKLPMPMATWMDIIKQANNLK